MKFIKWVVEIQVEESWIADGFNLTEERLHNMVSKDLAYIFSTEIKTKILNKPSTQRIKKLQGY